MRGFARIWLWAVVAVSLASCDSPEEKEAKHLARALAFFEEKADIKAMLELRNVLQLNPKNADAIYHAGLIHKRNRRPEHAIEAFYRATLERPSLIEAHHELGAMALGQGGIKIAADAADAILELEPDHPDGLALAAAVALRDQDVDRATALAERALAREPHHPQAVSVLAGLRNREGQPEQGLELVDAAIEARPEMALLRISKIALLEDMGDLERVFAAWGELIELEPELAAHRLALAAAFRHANRDEDAVEALRTAVLDGIVTNEIADALLEVVRQEHGFAAAEAELESLIALDPEDQAGIRFNLADLYIAEGRPLDARRVLSGIAEDAADYGARDDARAGMAEIDLGLGETAQAETLAADILEGNPDHATANLVLGLITLARKDPVEALRLGRASLRADPLWPPALRLIARAHLDEGKPALAVPVLTDVLQSDPGDLRSAELLAALLTRAGDYDSALKVWSHVLEIDGTRPEALQARARLLMRQRQFHLAGSDIARLAELPGQDFTSAVLSGEMLLRRGRHADGREVFLKAEELAPGSREPLLGLIRSYLSEADLEGALTFLEQRTSEHPDNALAWSFKAQILNRMDRTEAAEEALRTAIALAPEEIAHRRQLGRLLLSRNAPETAAQVLEEARSVAGDDPALMGELAWAYYSAGQPQAAIDTYARMLELEAASDQAANNYATLVATHRHDDPASLERALAVASRFRASDNPIRLDTLGWLYYRKGDLPVARTFLERAQSLNPDVPEIRYHLGMVLLGMGDEDAAIRHLEAATTGDAKFDGAEEARTTLKDLQDGPSSSGRS